MSAEGLDLDDARSTLERLKAESDGEVVSVDLVWRITTTDQRSS